jgi:hypothetical protein
MLENFLFLLVEEKNPLVDWVLSCGLLAGELLWCLVLHITHADDGCMHADGGGGAGVKAGSRRVTWLYAHNHHGLNTAGSHFSLCTLFMLMTITPPRVVMIMAETHSQGVYGWNLWNTGSHKVY